jgi:lipopolysaccharide export system protein LptA
VAAAALFLFSGAAHAQIGGSPDSPIIIVSDTFDGYQSDGRGVWKGNVRATQGESTMTTDKLTMVCSRAAPPSGQAVSDQPCEEVRQLIAEDNVLFVTPRMQIRGDRAEYDYPSDTITITGAVILTRDKDAVMRGSKVVYQVGAGLANISAGNDRVTSILQPERSNRPSAPPASPN